MSAEGFGGLPSAETADLEKASRDVIRHLSLMLKLAGVHDQGNEAMIRPLRLLDEAVGRLTAMIAPWALTVQHDHLFINHNRVGVDMATYSHHVRLVEELRRRGVGTLAFDKRPVATQLLELVYLLHRHQGPELEPLEISLRSAGLDFIRVEPPVEEPAPAGGEIDRSRRTRALARETFFGAVFLTGGLLNDVDRNRVVNVRRARRVVQSFLELLELDDQYLLGLTNIKNYDDYTFNHSVNVAVLALNMGRSLGLSRGQLADLGLSAIFHDLGKVNMPREIIQKESRLEDREWQIMHRHPVEGVKKLLRLKGISEMTVKLVISVYEHHLNFDFTGYPELPVGREVSLFSRILRVVDSYDAMTTRRPYGVPKHPVAALEEIWNLAGRNFDPGLVKVFVRMMGIFPVGTVLQLGGGEIALVTGTCREGTGAGLPIVEVLADWEGGRPVEGQRIDLSAPGAPLVIGYYDFRGTGFDPAWYLLQMGEREDG